MKLITFLYYMNLFLIGVSTYTIWHSDFYWHTTLALFANAYAAGFLRARGYE